MIKIAPGVEGSGKIFGEFWEDHKNYGTHFSTFFLASRPTNLPRLKAIPLGGTPSGYKLVRGNW